MPKWVETDDVRRMAAQGAQLLEVLPRPSYEEEHLPGALSAPLEEIAELARDLDPGAPTIVYCYDHQCDLSARGAAILEALGFTDVYDYVASKAAWLGEGEPAEGWAPASSRAGALARPVPTARLGERVGDLVHRFGDDGLVVVVDDASTILGVVRSEAATLAPETPVRELLRFDAPSVRPSITASELARSMDDDDRSYVLVSTLHGTLIGILTREDLHGQH